MVKKRQTLGRGLDALISGFNDANADYIDQKEAPEYELRLLDCHSILPNPYQPRRHFAPELIEELAQSIAHQGLLQPIVVTQKGDYYELIAGERRLRAFQHLNEVKIPALIRKGDDVSKALWGLIENLQRADLNCMEKARGLKRLVDEFGLGHEKIGEKIGFTRSYVSNMLRLTELAQPVQSMVEDNQLDMGHVRPLIGLDEGAQVLLAKKIHQAQLSARQAEEQVKLWNHQLKNTTPAPKTLQADTLPKPWHELEDQIMQKLGTHCKIQHKKDGKGSLVLNYQNPAHLDELLKLLGVDAQTL